ncbi:MAG: choice-of-anchor D domain-containing protein [Pseudomonadota bacterium]
MLLVSTVLIGIPASAFAQSYSESVVYTDAGTTVFEGTRTGTENNFSVDRVISLSLGGNGRFGGTLQLLDTAGTVDPTDDEIITALVRGDTLTANTIELVLQDNTIAQGTFVPTTDCRMLEPADCVDYEINESYLNDSGRLGFRASWIRPGGQDGGTIALWEESAGGRVRTLVQQAVDPSGPEFRARALWGFNNFNFVVGDAAVICTAPPATNLSGFRTNGQQSSADVRDITTTVPPALTFFDACQGVSFPTFDLRGGISPSANIIYFSGSQLDNGSFQQGIYRVGDTLFEYSDIDDTATSPIAVNDEGGAVYTVSASDGLGGFNTEIIRVRRLAFEYERAVIASEASATWAEIDATSIDTNSSGQIAFIGRQSASDPLAVWIFTDDFNGGGDFVEAGGRAIANLQFSNTSLNENGEVFVWGTDTNGAFQISLLSPSTSLAPNASLSTNALAFGPVMVGSSATLPVTLTNTGNQTLTIQRLETEESVSPFLVGTGDCGFTLAPSASCTFEVTFTPDVAGEISETLFVETDDPVRPVQTIALVGGNTTGVPQLVVPQVVNFGATPTGERSTAELTIENAGDTDLNISAITNPSPPFFVSGDTCSDPTVLAPQQTCVISYFFETNIASVFTDQIEITSDDPVRMMTTVTLSAEAIDATTGISIAVTDDREPADDLQVDFGVLGTGVGAMSMLTVTNTGGDPATLSRIAFTETSDAQFTIIAGADNCTNVTLQNLGDNCTVSVAFDSTETGTYSATLEIAPDGIDPTAVEFQAVAADVMYDLQTVMVASENTVESGSGTVFDFDITVSNEGPDAASGLVVDVILPSDLTVVGASTCSSGTSCFLDAEGNFAPQWAVGDIAAESSVTATIRVMESTMQTGVTECLVAQATASADPFDVDATNNVDTAVVGRGECGDLRITNTLVETARTENSVDFMVTATVTNEGPDTIDPVLVNGLFAPTFTGTFSGTPIVIEERSLGREGCSEIVATNGGSSARCILGPIAPGQSVSASYSFRVVIRFDFTVTSVTSVEGSNDPDTANNADGTVLEVPGLPGTLNEACPLAVSAANTSMESDLDSLRAFRDRWLMTNAPGRVVVAFYYERVTKISPFLTEHAWARAAVRVTMKPVVFTIKHPGWTLLMVITGLAGRRRLRRMLLPLIS